MVPSSAPQTPIQMNWPSPFPPQPPSTVSEIRARVEELNVILHSVVCVRLTLQEVRPAGHLRRSHRAASTNVTLPRQAVPPKLLLPPHPRSRLNRVQQICDMLGSTGIAPVSAGAITGETPVPPTRFLMDHPKLRKCPACKNIVGTGSRECPRCGIDFRRRRIRQVILWTSALAFAAWMARDYVRPMIGY